MSKRKKFSIHLMAILNCRDPRWSGLKDDRHSVLLAEPL
jgi:hypothetical protein